MNTFQKILLGLFSIITISIVYYAVFFLPSLKNEEIVFQKEKTCNQMISVFKEENKKEGILETGEGFKILKSTFFKEDNSCIVYALFSFMNNDYIGGEYKILDLNSNDTLASYSSLTGLGEKEDASFGNLDYLIELEKKYFRIQGLETKSLSYGR